MAAHYQWQVTVSDESHTVAAEFKRTTGGGRVTLDGRAVADWGWRWLALPTVTFEIGSARADLRPKGLSSWSRYELYLDGERVPRSERTG